MKLELEAEEIPVFTLDPSFNFISTNSSLIFISPNSSHESIVSFNPMATVGKHE